MKLSVPEVARNIYAVISHYMSDRFDESDAGISVMYSKLPAVIKEYITRADLSEIIHAKFLSTSREKIKLATNVDNNELTVSELKILSKTIAEYISKIPFQYKIYVPIPRSNIECGFSYDGVTIKESKTIDIFPPNPEISRQLIRFLEVGYVGNSDDNKLYLTILSDIKQFLYLACAGGAADRYADCKIDAINDYKIRIAIVDETNNIVVRRICPESIARLLKRIKFQCDSRLLKNVLNPAVNFIYSSDPNVNPIRFAIEWAFDAMVAEDETTGFINRCVAIEAILGEGKADDVGLTSTLSDRCAYLLGKSFSKRKYYREQFKKMYTLRSKIIHGRKKLEKADEEQIEFQREILNSIIFKELENLGYLKVLEKR